MKANPRLIEKHLEDITVNNLMDFRADSFSEFSSARGVKLGVNGVGQFVVKTRNDTFTINNPAEAIEKYSELIQS